MPGQREVDSDGGMEEVKSKGGPEGKTEGAEKEEMRVWECNDTERFTTEIKEEGGKSRR